MLVLYEYFWSLSLDDHEILYLREKNREKNKPIIEEKVKKIIDRFANNKLSKSI